MTLLTIPYLSHKHKEWLKPLVPEYHQRFLVTMKYLTPPSKPVKERIAKARQRWSITQMVLQ